MAEKEKKKKKKYTTMYPLAIVALILIALVANYSLFSMDDFNNTGKLVGEWESEDGDSLILKSNKVGYIGKKDLEQKMRWSVKGDTFSIESSPLGYPTDTEYTFVLDGDDLTLSDENGTTEYKRSSE